MGFFTVKKEIQFFCYFRLTSKKKKQSVYGVCTRVYGKWNVYLKCLCEYYSVFFVF